MKRSHQFDAQQREHRGQYLMLESGRISNLSCFCNKYRDLAHKSSYFTHVHFIPHKMKGGISVFF